MHSSYKWSKSLARKAEGLCGRGAAQQGMQSSAINYTGQLLDALMYFMLWELALYYVLQTYLSQLVESPQGSQLSHSVTGALVHRVNLHMEEESVPPSCQNSIQLEVMSSHLFSVQRNTQEVKVIIKPHIPLLYQFTSPSLSLCLYKHVSTNIISVQCHYCEIAAGIVSPAHFPASITHSSTRVLSLYPLPLQSRCSAY